MVSLARRAALSLLAAITVASAALADDVPAPNIAWSWAGPFGRYDRAAAQRGFRVYAEVCQTCHALRFAAYHNLGDIGFTEDEARGFAAARQVTDGPDENGDMFQRPGRLPDHLLSNFANDNMARAANNGALPPDLSLIVKARVGGANYVYGLLTGYQPAPAGEEPPPGMNYNRRFPGHFLAMPPPLSEGRMKYPDGTPATVEQMAYDVTTFLAWAAEPSLEARKRMGVRVILFLLVLGAMVFAIKQRVWARPH